MRSAFSDWSALSAWDVTFALLSIIVGWIASRLGASRDPWARPITIDGGRLIARVQVWHEPGRSRPAGGAAVRAVAASPADLGSDVLVTTGLPTSMTRTEER